jgi:hypothetical protein
MEQISRRDFVRSSMAAGAAATTAVASAGGSPSLPEADRRVKIVAISCSPRKGKATAAALGVCLQAAREVGDKPSRPS